MPHPPHVPEPSAKPNAAPPHVHHIPAQHAPAHHEAQPEDVDPLGRRHAHHIDPAERRVTHILVGSLVAAVVLIPVISAISASPVLNVLLGLSPLLITIILDIAATQQHLKPAAFWIILALIHALGLAVLWLINFALPIPLNVSSAVSVSLIIGVFVTMLCWLSNPKDAIPQHKKTHVVQFKPEKLVEYVQSIEDKCKALNFAIGRVYRNSNGGTPKVRERLRIPSEWYNEFHGIKAEDMHDQQENARVLVRKIRDRLGVHTMKEKDVFSPQELGTLKHLARHKDGEDRVIDVLKTNDRDPVEHYYVSAVEFCDRILEELEKMK